MATIKYGAPFPFGIAVTNPIYNLDPFAGPYENEADALAVFPATLREVGRAIGIYTDSTKKAVKVYNWEKNTNDIWVLKPQAGEYELTSAKIISALGYTPMATTHAAYNVTPSLMANWSTAYSNSHNHNNKDILDGINESKVNYWNGKMDKVTTDGDIVKVLGLDANNEAKKAKVVDIVGIWDANRGPTEQELIENFGDCLIVHSVATSPVWSYLNLGGTWKKFVLSNMT